MADDKKSHWLTRNHVERVVDQVLAKHGAIPQETPAEEAAPLDIAKPRLHAVPQARK